MTEQELQRIFTYHPPINDQQVRYEELRAAGYELAAKIIHSTKQSREQSIALTKLQEVIMFANAAIAIHE